MYDEPQTTTPDGLVFEALNQAVADARMPMLKIHRTDEPYNEFGDNDKLLYETHPYLFVLGRGLRTKGGLSPSMTRHILMQADGRFGRDTRLILTLMSQARRHATCRESVAQVRSDPASAARFMDILSAPNFDAELENARKNPRTRRARKFLKRLMSLVRVAGARVPYSPEARAAMFSKCVAMSQYMNTPAWFVTVAPLDTDSVLVVRLSTEPDKPTDTAECVEAKFYLPPDAERLRLALSNPVSSVEFYGRFVDALFTHLIGLREVRHTKASASVLRHRPPGVLGKPLGHIGGTEEQARLRLHLHFMLWVRHPDVSHFNHPCPLVVFLCVCRLRGLALRQLQAPSSTQQLRHWMPLPKRWGEWCVHISRT